MIPAQPPPPPSDIAIPDGAGLRVSRARWWIHLLLLATYPLILGVLGYLNTRDSAQPMLPRDTSGLLIVAAFEILVFGVIFGIAWSCSRASPTQLHLPWRGGVLPFLRGFGYAIGLRLLIALILLGLIVVALLSGLADLETMKAFMAENGPKVEKLVDSESLTRDPLYLTLNLTLISFVVAGFREELWRAGVIAGLVALFPRRFSSIPGRVAAVTIAAVIFGLGHLPQGWMAVGMIGFLGFGLGLILVFHRSIWDAVLAHGFFNAASFAMMYMIAKMASNSPSGVIH